MGETEKSVGDELGDEFGGEVGVGIKALLDFLAQEASIAQQEVRQNQRLDAVLGAGVSEKLRSHISNELAPVSELVILAIQGAHAVDEHGDFYKGTLFGHEFNERLAALTESQKLATITLLCTRWAAEMKARTVGITATWCEFLEYATADENNIFTIPGEGEEK